MDPAPLCRALAALAEDNARFFAGSASERGQRLARVSAALRDLARLLEPPLLRLRRLCPRFDLDEASPGNGYRSLLQAGLRGVAHALARSRAVAARRRSLFFRAAHSLAELEAAAAALEQLRALLCLARRLLARSPPGGLFPPEEAGVGELVLREYSTMRNGCFYGRCLGFQFPPSIRPLLQTIAIGLVSFGENYKRDMGLGVAAGSLFTSGKFAIDPDLRGEEFERRTQNLDVHFWKSFWNLTETELLASVASMAATQVGVCRALTVPPEPLELPLAKDPSVTVTISPPVAHTGPGPVHMRLLSYHLREGQDSAALSALTRAEGPWGPLRWWRGPPLPPSPALLVHFHGGGFVAQTSRSHEPYLRGWARDLGVPILSVDYALAPEAPFPRALEECFYAYCWALRNCRLLGSRAQRVCLAGDSAGGNLCLAVALRAAAVGVQPPDGLVVAYPVTLVAAAASPSRLLTLLDPLLPLGVLCKCLSAYAGVEGEAEPPPPDPPSPGGLLQDLRRGAASWLGGLLGNPREDKPPLKDPPRKSVSEAGAEEPSCPSSPPGTPPEGEESPPDWGDLPEYPDEFQPLRIKGPPARFLPPPAPLARNPFMSPLLAPDGMLGGLPPVHLVACALDPMLDDSVALARRLRGLGRPVTLRVLPDLPHGFLSLGPLSPETRRATELCTCLIRGVLHPPTDPLGPSRRGSLLLGTRRDSLAPLDGLRRGSGLGGHRDSLAPPLDSPRRGSLLLGTRRDSLAPQDPPRRGSVLLGGRRDSLAPPLDSPRRGSLLLGSRRESLGSHGVWGPTGPISRGAVTPSPGGAPPHGTGGLGAVANPGGGHTTLPHGTSTSPAVTHSDSPTVTHGTSPTVTYSTNTILPHSDGPTVTHGSSTSPTVTHSDGPTVTHGTSPTVTHSDGPTVTHGTSPTVTHGTSTSPPVTHSDGPTVTHGTSPTVTHSDGPTVTHGTSTSTILPHSTCTTHSEGPVLPPSPAQPPGPPAPLPSDRGSLPAPEARPPPCCGALADGGVPNPPDGPGPPRAPHPGRRLSGAQPLARRPSGPAGREVGS